jgi:mono/diheme cytochrome c family protein
MRVLISAALAAGLSLPLAAAPGPFPKGDPVEGKKLHEKSCSSCHNSMYHDRNGYQLYSSDHRKMTTASFLRQRVEACAARFNAGWMDEEIDSVSRWLNDEFYKFR